MNTFDAVAGAAIVGIVLACLAAAASSCAHDAGPSPTAGSPKVCATVEPESCLPFCEAALNPLNSYVALVDPTFGDLLMMVRCDVAFPGIES